jgi:hypothetical protein
MTRFKVVVDLGDAGVISEEASGNVSNALKMAYEKCKEKRTNPISVSVVQIAEADSGNWKPSIPSRS